MTKMTEISDTLAEEIERTRESHGVATLDATAEAVIALGLQAAESDDDD